MTFGELAVGARFRLHDRDDSKKVNNPNGYGAGTAEFLEKTSAMRAEETECSSYQEPNRYSIRKNAEVTEQWQDTLVNLLARGKREDIRRWSDTAYEFNSETQRYEHRELKMEEVSCMSYGDLYRIPEHYETILPSDLYIPELMSGSDYSGGAIQVSNLRAWKTDHSDLLCKYAWECYGGHGTYALAIRLDCPDESVWEDLQKLHDDYPVYDDEELYRVEEEAKEEAWDSWVRSDFRSELVKTFEEYEYGIERISDERLRVLFGSFEEGTEWINEEGNSAWVEVSEVVKAIPARAVRRAIRASCPEWTPETDSSF